jgi:ClpP class serine protease
MNHALAHEIYGKEPWGIQPSVVGPLLEAFREGKFNKESKLNTAGFISAISGAKVGEGGQSSSKTEKIISETNINGVILKSGGASTNGMKDLSAELISADKAENVIGHLFVFDTPGGSVAGMDYMIGTVRGLTKPKVGIVERSGIAASAGMGILAEMDYILCESPDCEVGSVGIICGVAGIANGEKDAEGQTHYVVYSSKAVDKNAAEELAINKGDTSLMQANADKAGDKFIAQIKAARPNVKDAQLTGKMYPASEVLGTMVDAIGSKMDAVGKIIELSGTKINTSKTNKAMTAAEYKAQHPEAHAEILAAGVSAEQERVKTWMAYAEIDPEAVQKGILSGNAVSGSEQASFLVKAAQGNALNAIKRDSAGNIIPAEAETKLEEVKTAKQLKDEAEFKAAFPKLVAKGITLEKFNATVKAN